MNKLIITGLALIISISAGWAQCETWVDSPKKDEAENAHVLYRQEVRGKNYAAALDFWKTAYNLAPGADGKRDFHYMDGITIHKELLANETDEAKKQAYKDIIVKLYSEVIACYEAQAIEIKDCDDDCYKAKVGWLQGRMGYDMVYTLGMNTPEAYTALEASIANTGNAVEYSVLEPVAYNAVYQFQNKGKTKEEMIALHAQLNNISDINIEQAEDEFYTGAWESTKTRVNNTFQPIEREIFDCDYFKARYEPMYEDNKGDFDLMKQIFNDLKRQGCPDTDPFMIEVKRNYESLAASFNAEKRAEWEANNPGSVAKKLYDSGDYAGAINKFKEAMNGVDDRKKAEYLFRIASIQFRKQKSYSAARSTALEAARLRPDWGRPWMLIGDMYASSSRNCGDSWNQRLAVLAAIDKYAKAKNIDSSVASEAGSRIAKYNNLRPDQEMGFMQGHKAGDSVKVGCWIPETVTLRF